MDAISVEIMSFDPGNPSLELVVWDGCALYDDSVNLTCCFYLSLRIWFLFFGETYHASCQSEVLED